MSKYVITEKEFREAALRSDRGEPEPTRFTLRRVREVLRDLECEKRKEADVWHNKGAKWEPLRLAAQADALDEAIRYLLELETAQPSLEGELRD